MFLRTQAQLQGGETATNIFFAVDQEVQRWLKENRISKMREEVDDGILEELPKIVTEVDLPEVFKIEEKDVEAPSGNLKKKQKTGEHQSKGNKVLNTDPNPKYKMLEGEDFKKVYCGKNAQHRPFWDRTKRTKMCHIFIQNITASTTAT